MSKVTVSAIQMAMTSQRQANLDIATKLVKQASQAGANIILLPELFMGLYFCQVENYDHFELAKPFEKNEDLMYFQKLAKSLNVVL